MPTCVFLEREVYAFLTNVVSGFAAQCCGPAFFLFIGGPQKATWTAGDGPAAGGSLAARTDCGQSNTGRTTRERRAEKGKTDVFLFLGERSEEYWLCPPDGSRSAAIATLEYRRCRENGARGLRHRAEPSLWRPVAVPAFPAYRP